MDEAVVESSCSAFNNCCSLRRPHRSLSTHFQCYALQPQTSQTRPDSQLVQQKAGEIGNVMGDAAILNVVNYVRIIFFFFFFFKYIIVIPLY